MRIFSLKIKVLSQLNSSMVMQSLHLVSSMVLTILSKEVSLCQVNYPPNLTQNRSRICPFSYFYFIALLEEALIGFYEVEGILLTKVMNEALISMTPNQFLSGTSIETEAMFSSGHTFRSQCEHCSQPKPLMLETWMCVLSWIWLRS